MVTTATAAEWLRYVMAQHPLPTYLRKHRRKWALTQRDLGELLNGSESIVSKYETLARSPSLEATLALELVFGEPCRDLFPAKYHEQRNAVVRTARAMLESLVDKQDRSSLRKRELLRDLITRSQQAYEGKP